MDSSTDRPLLRGIVLDFDGLIVDTETPVFQAWQAEARLLGGDLDLVTFAAVVGRHCSQEETVRLLLGAEQLPRIDEIYRRVQEHKREANDRTVARDGIPALVKDIRDRRLPVGIASSSPRGWVTGHLERLGLAGSFDAVRGSDDVGGIGKPAPDVYLAALDALGLSGSEALAVEDSVTGLAAAQAAGLRCVAAPGPITAGYDFGAADAFLPTLAGVDVATLADAVGMRA